MHPSAIAFEKLAPAGADLPSVAEHALSAEAARPCGRSGIVVRFLTRDDIPALLELERAKWEDDQAASAQVLQQRIEAYPRWCVAALDARSGKLLASLFVKPITDTEMQHCYTWADAAVVDASPADAHQRALFGISLSSIDKDAVESLLLFLIPLAIKSGKRHVYLGSPVPGLQKWRQKHPQADIARDYVFAKKQGLPVDPQLRYYHRKGFTTIIAAKPDYFPHRASLDYGAVLRMALPLSQLSMVWRWVPDEVMQAFFRRLARFL